MDKEKRKSPKAQLLDAKKLPDGAIDDDMLNKVSGGAGKFDDEPGEDAVKKVIKKKQFKL